VRTMTFTATALPRPRGGITIRLPFDPAEVWGQRDRYYVAGTIAQYPMRGVVAPGDDEPALSLGPAWCRDPRVGAGAVLRVSLEPEGPQIDTIAEDLADALTAAPAARRTFESLATHYRNGFVTWVEAAKRPETRAKRIAATGAALNAGRREP
jgi:hypothetical protein